jgi:hypothetical protein
MPLFFLPFFTPNMGTNAFQLPLDAKIPVLFRQRFIKR